MGLASVEAFIFNEQPMLWVKMNTFWLQAFSWVRYAILELKMVESCDFKHLPFVTYSFPREDEGSPRQAILAKFCQDEVNQFRACMNANNYDENKCLPTKAILDKCAAHAFKKVNAEPEWIFWACLKVLLLLLVGWKRENLESPAIPLQASAVDRVRESWLP